MVISRQSYAVGGMAEFKQRLLHRLKALSAEAGGGRITLPVAMLLVVDKANGGDATAEELVARFNLLDFESRKVIDFYFLGWQPASPEGRYKGIRFDLEEFASCRSTLAKVGLRKFGGNADLILVDALYDGQRAHLNFSSAIHMDLSRAVAERDIPSLGGFLQSLIDTAASVAESRAAGSDGHVFSISDKLGLAVARASILEFILKKLGEVIGAKKLASLAVRDIGPKVDLASLV